MTKPANPSSANPSDTVGTRQPTRNEAPVPTGNPEAGKADDPGTRAQRSDQEGDTPRLPHEWDETHESQQSRPRPVVKQALRDQQRGLEETDLYGSRGQRQGKPGND